MAGGSATPWGKMGPESEIHDAREYAEENGIKLDDELLILSVGYEAWRQERDVGDVWREVLAE